MSRIKLVVADASAAIARERRRTFRETPGPLTQELIHEGYEGYACTLPRGNCGDELR